MAKRSKKGDGEISDIFKVVKATPFHSDERVQYMSIEVFLGPGEMFITGDASETCYQEALRQRYLNRESGVARFDIKRDESVVAGCLYLGGLIKRPVSFAYKLRKNGSWEIAESYSFIGFRKFPETFRTV